MKHLSMVVISFVGLPIFSHDLPADVESLNPIELSLPTDPASAVPSENQLTSAKVNKLLKLPQIHSSVSTLNLPYAPFSAEYDAVRASMEMNAGIYSTWEARRQTRDQIDWSRLVDAIVAPSRLLQH